MIYPIKTYIELFGNKITPSVPYLPQVYYPSENGWISAIQETFTPENEGDPTYEVLGILYEQEFQRRFGKLRIPSDFRNIVNHWAEYGLTDYAHATTFENDSVLSFVAHRIPEWEKMYQALKTEYNPLENYDRIEDTTTTLTKDGTEETTKTGTESNEKTGSENFEKQGSEIDTPAGTETTTINNNYNGFNSSQSVPVSDSTETTSFTNRNNTKSFNQRKDVQSFTNRKDTLSFTDRKDTLSFDERTDTTVIDGHIHGNIGVTTSQQMLESELKLREYDLATFIYKEIASKFLLSVY